MQQLQAGQAGLVGQVARKYQAAGQALKIATMDQAATLIERHTENAQSHCEGGRGHQPMVAVWAEADLVVADEFRDGNMPATPAPLTCARAALAALPASVQERCFRGDSACHEAELLGWRRHPERAQEGGGAMGFAVSAVLSAALAQAVAQVPGARSVRLKKFRLLVVNLAGRMSRFRCVLRLRFCAPVEVIRRVLRIGEVFALPTQATAFP